MIIALPIHAIINQVQVSHYAAVLCAVPVSTQFHICTLDREKFNVFDRNSGFFNAFYFANGKYEAKMAVLNMNRQKKIEHERIGSRHIHQMCFINFFLCLALCNSKYLQWHEI